MNNEKKSFIDDLIREINGNEMEKMKREAGKKISFFDIETGSGTNEMVDKLRIKNIRSEIMSDEYKWRDDYKDSTNEKKRMEFEEKKAERIAREIQKMSKENSLNPYFNRVVIVSVIKGKSEYQFDELSLSEKQITEEFFKLIQGTTVIGYNSTAFDMLTMKIKAAKYGIRTGFFHHIDVMEKLKAWPVYGKPIVVSQDILAAVLGIEPNRYGSDVDRSEIGNIFEQARLGVITQELSDKLETIKKYGMDDCRVLKEIYDKLVGVFL